MVNLEGTELLTKTARYEHIKEICEKKFVSWYVREVIEKIFVSIEQHTVVDQLSLHPKFSDDLIKSLLGSGSFLLDKTSITLPQLLDRMMGHKIYLTRVKEMGPAKRGDTNCLTNRNLRDIYQNEVFFCEMLAFYPRETVVDQFFKLKLPMDELALNDFGLLNPERTDFVDPLWKQFFLARYIAHAYQLQPRNAKFNDLDTWIKENKKDNKHLNLWMFTSWIMLANQAYDPLKEFHHALLEGFNKDNQHDIAIYQSCQDGIQQFMREDEKDECDNNASNHDKLNSRVSQIEAHDYQTRLSSPVMKVFRLTVPEKKDNGANNNASSSSKCK